nr:hypothetical protein [Candidatus Sigynarchaeota archaeon]
MPNNAEYGEKKQNSRADEGSRITAIDYLKGIAVIWFTIGHAIMYWENGTWRSIAALAAFVMDWTGPGLFIAFTMLGTMISIKKRELTGNTRGMFKNAFIKSTFLLIVGECLNLVIEVTSGNAFGIWHVFGANMITVVGLAQIFTYGLVKISNNHRILLFFGLVIAYPVLLLSCLTQIGYDGSGALPVTATLLVTPAHIVYYLLFYMDAMAPTVSWLIVAVLASIIFEGYSTRFVNSSITKNNARDKGNDSRRFALIGCVLVLLALAAGGFILTRGVGMSGWEYDFFVNDDPFRFYTLSGLPLIIVRHVPNYLVINMGILLIAFGLTRYLIDVKGYHLVGKDTIILLGKYSFSIFVYGHLLALIPIKLPLYTFVILVSGIIALILVLVKPWDRRAHGIASLEWLLVQYVKLFQKKAVKRRTVEL